MHCCSSNDSLASGPHSWANWPLCWRLARRRSSRRSSNLTRDGCSSKSAAGAWGQSLVWAATALWLVHLVLSMITTRAAWGVYVAWFEPRTRFTFLLGAASLLILAAAYLVDDRRFTALAYAVLAAAATALQPLLGTIQHPLNPIGASPSLVIRAFYAAILVVCLALGVLLTLWLHQRLAGRA